MENVRVPEMGDWICDRSSFLVLLRMIGDLNVCGILHHHQAEVRPGLVVTVVVYHLEW